MSAAAEHQALLRGLVETLREMAAEGLETLPRPAAMPASDVPIPAAPRSAAPRSAAPTPAAPTVETPAPRTGPVSSLGVETLEAIRADLGDCTRCGLCRERSHLVFGEGNPRASVVFVGEGPGADEDRTGRPFVGKAGRLLDKMIEAVGWRREDVYICNVVKCRPPRNRNPEQEEIATCRPFLDRQLRAIAPRAIITLGKPAAATLLGRSVAITRERGIWREWEGVPLMPTFHPAYLLRSYTRENRQAVWDDLRAVRARVDGS